MTDPRARLPATLAAVAVAALAGGLVLVAAGALEWSREALSGALFMLAGIGLLLLEARRES